MEHSIPFTERTIVVRYDPEQAPAIAYHRDHGQLVVTFGPAQTSVEHLLMVLRREVDPDIARLAGDQIAGDERRAAGAFPDHLLDNDTDGGDR